MTGVTEFKYLNSVFWAKKWEVRVERTRKVKKDTGSTNQWIQEEGSVVLAALWLCGRRYEDMKKGSSFNEVWNPMLEANPLHMRPRRQP